VSVGKALEARQGRDGRLCRLARCAARHSRFSRPLAVITLRRVTKPKAKVGYSSQAILRTHPLAGVSMIPTVVRAV